uniref:Uncharacterized protein n=1 Tax=Rhizophora mucronata TaxID=61149 RepID=A0A2P2N0F9_RHIMU
MLFHLSNRTQGAQNTFALLGFGSSPWILLILPLSLKIENRNLREQWQECLIYGH